jgi:hypothetical protein
MLHGTQLSFIQLGGGIAVGVHTKRRKYYTLLGAPKRLSSNGVPLPYGQPRKFVPNYLMTSFADVERWERPMRYHYCRIHDLLCGFPKSLPPGSGEQ